MIDSYNIQEMYLELLEKDQKFYLGFLDEDLFLRFESNRKLVFVFKPSVAKENGNFAFWCDAMRTGRKITEVAKKLTEHNIDPESYYSEDIIWRNLNYSTALIYELPRDIVLNKSLDEHGSRFHR